MRIESNATLADMPILEIRNLLKRNRCCNWSAATVRYAFKTSFKNARHTISKLENAGYIEPVIVGKKTYWKNTLKGNTLAMATAAKPILRATADKKISEFLERVAVVNSENYFLYEVVEVAVFGSYLSNKERINDIDISISLEPKNTDTIRQQELDLERTNEAIEDGRKFSNTLEALYWPEYQIVRFLKSHSRSISLHQDEGLLKRCKHKILYKLSEVTGLVG